jgi:hypothetical protein
MCFSAGGEHRAVALTVKMAHTGLMNSPGHRANIMRPAIRKVGIGMMGAGAHGLMVTQEAATDCQTRSVQPVLLFYFLHVCYCCNAVLQEISHASCFGREVPLGSVIFLKTPLALRLARRSWRRCLVSDSYLCESWHGAVPLAQNNALEG